jgi:hypothetical protein
MASEVSDKASNTLSDKKALRCSWYPTNRDSDRLGLFIRYWKANKGRVSYSRKHTLQRQTSKRRSIYSERNLNGSENSGQNENRDPAQKARDETF